MSRKNSIKFYYRNRSVLRRVEPLKEMVALDDLNISRTLERFSATKFILMNVIQVSFGSILTNFSLGSWIGRMTEIRERRCQLYRQSAFVPTVSRHYEKM